jgi:DNA polymerase III epsilon subunit-like protein
MGCARLTHSFTHSPSTGVPPQSKHGLHHVAGDEAAIVSSASAPAAPHSARATQHVALAPCVLDIEASGFGRHSYPIEVGYVLPSGQARCMLVRPTEDWTHWDAAAEGVHGISRDTLLNHGLPAPDVARALNHDLRGQTVYCDGWAHDYAWLAALFDAAGLRAEFRLESVNVLLADEALARLDEARRAAQTDLGLTRHRASNDARALQRALMVVRATD